MDLWNLREPFSRLEPCSLAVPLDTGNPPPLAAEPGGPRQTPQPARLRTEPGGLLPRQRGVSRRPRRSRSYRPLRPARPRRDPSPDRRQLYAARVQPPARPALGGHARGRLGDDLDRIDAAFDQHPTSRTAGHLRIPRPRLGGAFLSTSTSPAARRTRRSGPGPGGHFLQRRRFAQPPAWPEFWPGVVGHHGVFHLWVMAGSLAHFWFMLTVVVPFAAAASSEAAGPGWDGNRQVGTAGPVARCGYTGIVDAALGALTRSPRRTGLAAGRTRRPLTSRVTRADRMKLLAVSDLHGDLAALDEAVARFQPDVVVSCGDWEKRPTSTWSPSNGWPLVIPWSPPSATTTPRNAWNRSGTPTGRGS